MSTTEEEINETLDALEKEHKVPDDQEVELESKDLEVSGPPEKPPGFITYDEWIEKGKDPADFRGENAYKTQYEALKEVRELKSTMNRVVEGVDTWKQQQSEQMARQVEQARTDAVIELETAKKAEDMTAALTAQDKLNKLDNQVAPQPPASAPTTNFITDNPILDQNSSQFDSVIFEDMRTINNSNLDVLLAGDRDKIDDLSQEQKDRTLKNAFEQAKRMHPDKFVSPRNKRQTTPQPKQRQVPSRGDVKSRLKQIPSDQRNPRDTSAANDIHEMLKEMDPDGTTAEIFANNVLGDS